MIRFRTAAIAAFLSATAPLALSAASTPVDVQAQTPRPQMTPAQHDEMLKDRIARRVESNQITGKYDINVKVANGVATLTGEVATAAQKAEAERVAKIDGITKVDNMIKVDAAVDKTLADRAKAGMNRAGQAITDAWITTKVKWFFVGEDLLEGSSINVDTANKVVTLNGTVKSEAGKKHAGDLAKWTDGVTRVVNNLTIK